MGAEHIASGGVGAWCGYPFRGTRRSLAKILRVANSRVACEALECRRLLSVTPVGSITPEQMRRIYGVDSINFGGVVGDGAGQVVAIIDATNDPRIQTDLATFDAQYDIPAPPWFRVINQNNSGGLPSANNPVHDGNTNAAEISLDVEWSHVIAPAASILLIEANSLSNGNVLSAAVKTADAYPGVSVVSMSFGQHEFNPLIGYKETHYDAGFHSNPNITFVASTGDTGSPGEYPAFSDYVVAVGGTTTTVGAGNIYGSETGWSGSGGGISKYEPTPFFQHGSSRTIPDVSMDANPNTGVPIVDSWDNGPASPWYDNYYGGTSLASPMFAGLVAIADQGRDIAGEPHLGSSDTLRVLYSNEGDFHDITSGSNGGFTAGPGYDLVTGLGTPIANRLVNALAGVAPADPANDNFAHAATISGLVATATGTNVGATFEPGEPNPFTGFQSVWYKWKSPNIASTVTLSTANSDFDTTLGVYTGSSVSSLTQIAVNDDDTAQGLKSSAITFSAVPTLTYYFQVNGKTDTPGGGNSTSQGIIHLSLSATLSPGNFAVTNTLNSGPGSLRQAIIDADDSGKGGDIVFFIPTSDPGYANGVFTIAPLSELPIITDPGLSIEGVTQVNFTGNTNGGRPVIFLSGLSAGSFSNGLMITTSATTIDDLGVEYFRPELFSAGGGIVITGSGATYNKISDCFIGVSPSGTRAAGNTVGVWVGDGASNNSIGYTRFIFSLKGITRLNFGNVIAGNTVAGVEFVGAVDNEIDSDQIGIDTTTEVAIPNAIGVNIFSTAADGISAFNTIDDNAIDDNTGDGVQLSGTGTTDNVFTANTIGVTSGSIGYLDEGNGGDGIQIESNADDNVIGGNNVTEPGVGNLIAGNKSSGIEIDSAAGNTVEGNTIGEATYVLISRIGLHIFNNPNGAYGVSIGGGATSNTIGGKINGLGNIISGNALAGVVIGGSTSTSNIISGNTIGLNAGGDDAGNAHEGLLIFGDKNSITGNVISGNGYSGISLPGNSNTVSGNKIGTNLAGTAAIANAHPGVFINGADNTLSGNTIFGNLMAGVELSTASATGNILTGNWIGTNAAGTAGLGNVIGVEIDSGATKNTIGGTASGDGNVIAYNTGAGVQITGTGTGNAVLGNSDFSNTSIGIDLGGDGVTPNDAGDLDTGPNNLQNFPVLISASGKTIVGTFNSTPSTTFRIEIFSSKSPDPTGYGGGQTFLGFKSLTTDSSGNLSFTITLSTALANGDFVTATATDSHNNTSEFSNAVKVGAQAKFSAAVLSTSGLVADWSFDSADGASTYSLVNGFRATITGGQVSINLGAGAPISGDSGNQSVVFAGNGSYLNTNLVSQQTFNNAGTFMCWVNFGETPAQAGRTLSILAKSQFGNDLDLQAETDGKIHFYTDNGTSLAFTPPSLTGWHLLTATFSQNPFSVGTRTLYWDGKQVATGAEGASHSPSTDPFSIGGSDVFSGRTFDGEIDEVSLFDRALSATEISTIYLDSKS